MPSDSMFPNTTQFPDILLDYWMAELSHTEWKVLCYIVRHTYGFRKVEDAISLAQFERGIPRKDGSLLNRGCGMSRSTICTALQSLEAHGLVHRTASPAEKGKNTPVTRYALTFNDAVIDDAKLRLVVGGSPRIVHPVSENRTPRESENRTPGSPRIVHTTPTYPTPTQQTHEQQGTEGASAPRADKPRRPSLKQDHPDIWRQREAIREAYTAISGQARNKWTNADCEALARDYGAEDSIATLTAMWGVQWANGRYPYRSPLKLSTAHELVPAWRRGELRSDPPATKGKAQQQALPAILTHEQAQATTTAYCRQCRMNAPANHKATCKSGLSGPVGA